MYMYVLHPGRCLAKSIDLSPRPAGTLLLFRLINSFDSGQVHGPMGRGPINRVTSMGSAVAVDLDFASGPAFALAFDLPLAFT